MKQKAKEEDTGNRKSMARAGFMAGLAHTTHAFDIRMPFTHLLLGVVCRLVRTRRAKIRMSNCVSEGDT